MTNAMTAWQEWSKNESLLLSASEEPIPHSDIWKAVETTGLPIIEQEELITLGIVAPSRISLSLVFQEEVLLIVTTR
jgi:hypothetical protein